MAETLYLLDGHAQIYRAYYAPFRDLTSPTGEPTRATYVFFSMLFNLIQRRRPTYLAMVMDAPDAAESRRTLYAEYKANREPPPDDLCPQVDRIVAVLQAMGIPILQQPGFEADDVMATLVRRLSDKPLDLFLVSRDKDLEQLITQQVRLYDPMKDEVIDQATLQATKGYSPEKAIEIQTLVGDKIDNIPGIDGVGLKTAAKLIARYGSAENVLAHADELTPKTAQRVKAFAAQLPITRELVTLRADLDVMLDLEEARFEGVNSEALQPIFQELGFTRLLTQLDVLAAPAVTRAGPAESSVTASAASTGRYQLVNTPAQLRALADQLNRAAAFALDTETTALQPVEAELVGLSFCWQPGQASYVPVRGIGGDILDLATVRQQLSPALGNPAIVKCGHNLKYDLIVLEQAGITVEGQLFDSMIASFLLDPLRRSHSLDWLARERFQHIKIPTTDLLGKGKNQITMDQVDIARVCEYAAEDADFTWRLYEALKPEVEQGGLLQLLTETEMPLLRVLVRMELNGVALDEPFLQEMGGDLEQRIQALTCEVHTLAGRPFNIDSTKQLAEVLFDELGLPSIRKTKTGRSTDADTLRTLAEQTEHPLPSRVLAYRELVKLKSTYVDNLPAMVSRKTHRLHATFNQIGAVTGRLSSSEPNLQNIPIRTELGREIRKAFVAGRPDAVLLSADYSQIELRILAHFCGDEALVAAFEQDQDIHRVVAAEVFDVPAEAVSSAQRSQAKAVNFGIIYGQSAFGLARSTGMSVSDARRFIELYFERYKSIQAFIDECIERATERGFATTLLGRRRPLPELRSRNRQKRMQGERLAVNTVLQGSAADLIKVAMVRIQEHVDRDPRHPLMLIQVHDELVFEVPADDAEAFAPVVQKLMCTALPLNVPLKVDVNWGRRWFDSH